MWGTPGGYYTTATYAPAAYLSPPFGHPSASPRLPMQSSALAVAQSSYQEPRLNPNCAGNDVGACIGRCHLCTGGCGRNGNKCMACVGGCQGAERAGYALGHPLCEGRYGFVRTAVKDGKTFAMKVIPIDKFTKSEIELQTLLPDHPHIVQVYEAFKTENVIILVLEYCQHGDLFEYMQKRREEFKGRTMDEDQVRNFFLQILSPVRDLHQLKVAHHDIKLENYLLTNGKMGKLTLKLADFGAAEKLERSNITTCRKGHISPEKKVYIDTGRPYCAFKSDLYQLGSALHEVAFEMREPRPDGSINPPDRHRPSPELQDLLGRLLVLDPARRISMEEVLRHPWVTQDRALYDQCLNKSPTPLSARNRPAEAPTAKPTKPEPTPAPAYNTPTPLPLKAQQNGVMPKPVPEVPRLPLGTSLQHNSALDGNRGPTPQGKEAPPRASVSGAGSRIVVTPRKVESPRVTVHSARSTGSTHTPRTTSAGGRPTSAPGNPTQVVERSHVVSASHVVERSHAAHPTQVVERSHAASATHAIERSHPPAASAPTPAAPPLSAASPSGQRLAVNSANTTSSSASRLASPAAAYSLGYNTTPAAYSYASGYSSGYSNLVPNQYYTSSVPTSYVASSGIYTSREPTTISPRTYGYSSTVSPSPYGTSYVISSDPMGSYSATRTYTAMADSSAAAYTASLTPRQYYV
eukprot:EG_transcript_3827